MSHETRHALPQPLYRILEPREGDGLTGVESRESRAFHGKKVSKCRSCTIAQHVAENPKITPYISASSDLAHQMKLIRKKLLENGCSEVVMITIDTKTLQRLGSEIIDLSNREGRDYFLGDNRKAWNYARAWSEVLVKDQIPKEAVIESTLFYLDESTGQVKSITTKNPFFVKTQGF